ncbi:putative TIR domain, P-loop containing nucleoside triphosphate hydrolase [Helianthus annuus]|nr:putative TIR domain, P-loop containing nucleoside triphosphate hydrolase [Helianthus annuus]
MASSSSSTDAIACRYDVFLSFRGEDTRHSFTDHLYDRLKRAGICTFRDEEEISRGEELKPEIEKAIKASTASIVILSKNYATSAWCLDELVLILQQRKVFSHFVLPIFYHVAPTDVRKQKGSFAVEKDRWKTALTEVANLSGFTLSGPETRTLKEIVDTIYNWLDKKEVHLPLNLTGMSSRYKEISSWLDQCDLEFLAIYGMGGSGKTTLAKYIYNLHQRNFEYVSFVEDIGSRCKTYNDLLELQKQLHKDIVGGKKRKIPGISRGMCMIEEVLQMNKTLIVLDDIVERSQLVSLLGTGKINSQSKIIITTRENIDNWFDFPYWRFQKYEMKLLNYDESMELFCRHALPSEIHHEGYDQVVKYCEGNPLALEVLGSSTFKYNADMIMPSQLRLLETDMDSRIQSVLMRSYLSLSNNTVKELFLHIACFFIGIDIDYAVKILEPDYAARSGIETLLEKCLLSVSPKKKLMMHRLLQEMAKSIVRQESPKFPTKRSRVWLSSDSYKILSKGKGSETIEGLILDMKMLQKEDFAFKVLQSLQILNLKDSHNLAEISNFFNVPCLETLVLWNCYSLVNVCKSIGDLTSLTSLNMTGCKNLFNREQINLLETSSGGVVKKQPTFSLPFSLHQLFLKDCSLECTHSFPLSFNVQPYLQYLNLCNSLLESLPCYNHLENLRVLDLSFCSRLKCLLCFPSTLAELYIYYCESLEKITFQSHRFPLQELGYEGCVNLYEIEDYVKLVPLAKLDETDLGHMRWLKEYQNYQVCLVGDDELTVGRSWHIQMLYEFNIMSTSLPNINDPRMTPKYMSESSSLSFDVPSCPKNKRLKGINVTFKYSVSGVDWAWFCKVSTTNGVVDLMYSPKVFGKPEFGEVGICGLEVHECGVSLVYSDKETMENNMGGVEILRGDLPGFQLSTGAYYLCRQDFFELMEVGRLTRDWFRVLVGDNIDYTEVRGWRKNGRLKQMNPSFKELKTVSCIIHGPQWVSLLCYMLNLGTRSER